MLEVITICEKSDNSNTYIVRDTKNAIIIDPSNSLSSIKIAVKGLNVIGVFLTHGHYDHFAALADVCNHYHATLYLHRNAYSKLSNESTSCSRFFNNAKVLDPQQFTYSFLEDGKILELAPNFSLKTLFTPGHTNCSIVLLLENMMFSGDTLFYNGVGRSDLPTSSTTNLVLSIKKLLNLTTDYIVYPGHGEETTIYNERQNNPFYLRIMKNHN